MQASGKLQISVVNIRFRGRAGERDVQRSKVDAKAKHRVRVERAAELRKLLVLIVFPGFKFELGSPNPRHDCRAGLHSDAGESNDYFLGGLPGAASQPEPMGRSPSPSGRGGADPTRDIDRASEPPSVTAAASAGA